MRANFLVPFALRLRDRVIAKRPKPDFVIGDPAEPYMNRWWVIPRNKWFNVYLHQFLRSDDDRALHNHPWIFNASFLIAGQYREHTIAYGGINHRKLYETGELKFRGWNAAHRVELVNTYKTVKDLLENNPVPAPCWTLFITGPVIQEWGFFCEKAGFVHWKDFCKPDEPGQRGAGCGEHDH